jgi:uncharacterized protein (DUF1778 family)
MVMGRPKKSDEEKRENVLRIRLTDEERRIIDRAAGSETSTWARNELLELAKKILIKRKKSDKIE